MKKSDLIFGTRAVIEGIRGGREIDKILLQKNLANPLLDELHEVLRGRNIPVQKVPVEKLKRINSGNHQGVIAFVSPIEFASLDNIIDTCYQNAEDPLLLMLDRITDMRNFGAISRTAESAGVHAIIVPLKNSAAISADAVKTSAGALNHIPVCREKDLKITQKYLTEYGIKCAALTEKASEVIYEKDMTGPLCLILGSEEDGISEALIRKSDILVKIPMYGEVSSLNVSVSAAVATYEVIRQRELGK